VRKILYVIVAVFATRVDRVPIPVLMTLKQRQFVRRAFDRLVVLV
jgi:hypothetical protein